MESVTVATNSNRAFNWDDDDEDDFDLDAWKATVDTSAPSVCELGPLQSSPTGDEVEKDETYSCEIIRNERALLGTPAPETKETDVSQSPTAFEGSEGIPEPDAIDVPIESYDEDFPDCPADSEVVSAQYEHVVHAIGPHYDGREEAATPAYPELSCDAFQRYRYAKEFQATRYNTARPVAEVYRHSPLAFVTSIDEAHLIPDKIRTVLGEDAGAEEKIENCEAHHIVAFEKRELQTQGANEEMCQEIKHMLTEQIERGFDVQTRFSKDELESFFRLWKAQQDDSGDEADAEDVDDGEFEYDDDDADSVDTWELSDSSEDEEEEGEEDEDVVESLEDTEEGNKNTFSITHSEEHDTPDSADELDFNDVVFGRGSETGVGDSLVRDEGYVSSSPPVSPIVDIFAVDSCDEGKSCFESGTQSDADPRVDSMYTLDEPEATSEDMGAIECDAADNQPTVMPGESKDADKTDGYNNVAAEAIDCAEAILTTTPPLEIAEERKEQISTSKSLLTQILFNAGTLPWASIGLVTAGAVIGGLVGAARRR
ncbi:NAD(P)-binding protein [Stemphylium lycopersici]|nr:NAD(P)-binding protein [Stemphylium lycopersici]